MNAMSILRHGTHRKRDVRQQVDLVDDTGLTGTKRLGIFSRLVVPLGHTQHHDSNVFTQIVRSRADQVSNILYDQEFDSVRVELLPTRQYQWQFQMTRSTCSIVSLASLV